MLPFRLVAGPHNALLYVACIGLIWVASFAFSVFASNYDFIVLGSESVCEQPLNNRCQLEFKVRRSGASQVETRTFNMYEFRLEELAVGNRILKRPLSFSYFVNGQLTKWAHGTELLTILLFAAGALAVWYRWSKALS